MQIQTFYIPAHNHTYGDELVAVGFADLVRELSGGADVAVMRNGDGLMVKVDRPVDTDTMPVSADPYLDIKFDAKDLRASPGAFDYQREREREAAWRKWQAQQDKASTSKGKQAAARVARIALDQETTPEPPRPDFRVFKALNSMRKGSTSYQDIGRAWLALPVERRRRLLADRLVRLALDLGDRIDSEQELAPELEAKVRALQFFDPVVGKGASRTKPNGATPSSYDHARVDWFEELLKYRAMHVGMVAYSTGAGGADTRTFVLSPQDIPVAALRQVRTDLLQAPVYGSIQAELRALIAVTEALIRRSEFMRTADDSPFVLFDGRAPDQVLGGLNSAFFLSLGSAAAVMNVSFLGLPGWFPVTATQDVEAWLALLDQFRRATNSLPEDRSENVPVLQSMLRCLSAGTLDAALEFFGRYATVLLHSGRTHPRFMTTELGRIFAPMETKQEKLKPIIDTPGFKAVARAIRQATVTEMFHKSKQQQEYEVRYGLAQEWRRAARVRDDFVNELTKFVADFEYEAARKQEQGERVRRHRARPTTAELGEVIELVDRYGSELVCGLLLAFGFAREPYDREDAPAGDADDEQKGA